LAANPTASLAAQDFFSPRTPPRSTRRILTSAPAERSGCPPGPKASTEPPSSAREVRPDIHPEPQQAGRTGPRSQRPATRPSASSCCFRRPVRACPRLSVTPRPGPSITPPRITSCTTWENKDYLREMKLGSIAPARRTCHRGDQLVHARVHCRVADSDLQRNQPFIRDPLGDPAPLTSAARADTVRIPAVPASTCTWGSPCKLSPLWSAPIGTASKFGSRPRRRRVYVGPGTAMSSLRLTTAAPLAGAAPPASARPRSAQPHQQCHRNRVHEHRRFRRIDECRRLRRSVHRRSGHRDRERRTTQVPVTFPSTLSKRRRAARAGDIKPTAPGGAAGALSFAVQSPSCPR